MAYLRPAWFQRKVFNPIATRFGISGSVGLAVPGRKSGKMHEIPVIPVEVDGVTYIVSPRGEAEWVRNLRANGGRGELRRRSGTQPFTSTEVPLEARGPILTAYRKKAGAAVKGYFAKLPDDKDHPVFRLD
jgi:hypothetical protein